MDRIHAMNGLLIGDINDTLNREVIGNEVKETARQEEDVAYGQAFIE